MQALSHAALQAFGVGRLDDSIQRQPAAQLEAAAGAQRIVAQISHGIQLHSRRREAKGRKATRSGRAMHWRVQPTWHQQSHQHPDPLDRAVVMD